MKMLSRDEAVKKWKTLSDEKKKELIKKHRPGWTIEKISAFPPAIQKILNSD
jgi:hypothetical protein